MCNPAPAVMPKQEEEEMMASMYSTSPESFSSWASSPADAQATRPATTSGSSNPHNGAAGGEVGMHHPQHQYHHGLACSDLVGDFGVAGSTNTDPAAGFERSCVSAQRQQQVMGIDTVAADGQRTGSHSHQHQHQHHEATDTEREERGCDGVVEESGLAQEVRGRAGAFSKAQSLVVKEEEVGEHDNGFGMFGFGFADDIRHHHLPSSSTNTNPSMPLSPLPLTATTNTAATGTRSTLGGFDDAFASEPFLPGDGMDMNMSMDLNAAGKRSPGLDSCSSWPDMDMDMGASTSSASHFEESPAKRARVSHQQPHHVSQPANSKAGKKRAAMRNNNSSSSSNNGGKSTKAPSTTATTTTTAATTATATANTTELLPEEVRTKNAVLQRLGRERSPEQLKALEAKVTGYIDSLPDEKTRKKLRDELPVFGRWASMSVAELRQAEYDLLCLILGSPPDENLTDIEQFLSLTSEDRRGRKAQLRSKKNRRLTKKRIIELERQLDDATARELKKDQQLALLQKKCNKLMELARQHPDFALLSLDN